jgi:hypothetical protein
MRKINTFPGISLPDQSVIQQTLPNLIIRKMKKKRRREGGRERALSCIVKSLLLPQYTTKMSHGGGA